MVPDFDLLSRWAGAAHKGGLLPSDVRSPEAALYLMASGLEIGLQPMQSLRDLRIVKGRVTIPAAAMQSLAHRAGVTAEWVETTDTAAVVRLSRAGQAAREFAFREADARRAGLWGNAGPWTQYPRAMLIARCISAAIRAYCPDVLGGGPVYVPGEIPDDASTEAPSRARAITDREVPAETPAPERVAIAATTVQVEPSTVTAAEPVSARVERAVAHLGRLGWLDDAEAEHGPRDQWDDRVLGLLRERMRAGWPALRQPGEEG